MSTQYFKKELGLRKQWLSKTPFFPLQGRQIPVYIGVFGGSSQKMEPTRGLEPPTTCLQNKWSATSTRNERGYDSRAEAVVDVDDADIGRAGVEHRQKRRDALEMGAVTD